jgi:hypothetical protein
MKSFALKYEGCFFTPSRGNEIKVEKRAKYLIRKRSGEKSVSAVLNEEPT